MNYVCRDGIWALSLPMLSLPYLTLTLTLPLSTFYPFHPPTIFYPILSLGRATNFSGFTIEIVSTRFKMNKTSIMYTQAIGPGCNDFNGCNGNGVGLNQPLFHPFLSNLLFLPLPLI